MDYSLLLGIHDVGRAEREEEEGEEVSNEEEPEAENGLAPGATAGSYGTSPEGIAGYMSACKPLGPGEFDPYVDVYAVGSCAGEVNITPIKTLNCDVWQEEEDILNPQRVNSIDTT